MFPNYYVLYKTDPNSKDAEYNLIYTELSVHRIRSMRAPHIHVKTRCGHSSLFYGIHAGDLDPNRSEVANMGSERVNGTVQ